MKRLLFALIFLGVFIWGLFTLFNRGDRDLKNVGEVSVISTVDGNSKCCELKGEKICKRYEDEITDFDVTALSEFAADAVTVEKPETIDEENHIAVKYKGEFIDEEEKDIYYSIYDKDFNLLYETDTLGVLFEKGSEYYAVMDVKWGRIKNYVCLRYCFRITT